MIITQTPLRISFLGGNTDFPEFFQVHGGCVLTTAIDKYVYCIVNKRFDDLIRVSWSKLESATKVDDIEHELAREALKKVGITKSVEIKYLADIPSEGSGLGSSSSVLVGTLNALCHYVGEPKDAEWLAREACEIEVKILKKPIGFQDQYISAFGGARFIEFSKLGAVTPQRLRLEPKVLQEINDSMMLFYTGQTRLSKQILSQVKATLTDHTKTLLANKDLAIKGRAYLEKGNIKGLGQLLHQYWLLKKKINSGISNQAIDKMYRRAIKAGAYGGKIAGAGGGGFLLVLVPPSKRSLIREALDDYRELPIKLEFDGSKVIFNARKA